MFWSGAQAWCCFVSLSAKNLLSQSPAERRNTITNRLFHGTSALPRLSLFSKTGECKPARRYRYPRGRAVRTLRAKAYQSPIALRAQEDITRALDLQTYDTSRISGSQRMRLSPDRISPPANDSSPGRGEFF